MEKVVDWFEDNEDISKEDTIIDLGSGNGMMCIELVCYCNCLYCLNYPTYFLSY
jgi:methylase of polypeptide subunit release factors